MDACREYRTSTTATCVPDRRGSPAQPPKGDVDVCIAFCWHRLIPAHHHSAIDGDVRGRRYNGQSSMVTAGEKETFAAVLGPRYPTSYAYDALQVIFNNQLLPPQVTAPNWPTVVSRSLEMATRASTLTALRHLYSISEIAPQAQGHHRIAWWPFERAGCPGAGVFKEKTMNNLVDLGAHGRDPPVGG